MSVTFHDKVQKRVDGSLKIKDELAVQQRQLKPLKAEHETKDITFDPKKVQNEIMCSHQDMAEIP